MIVNVASFNQSDVMLMATVYSHNGFDYVSQGQTETRRITNVNENVTALDKPFKSIQHLFVTHVIICDDVCDDDC